MKHSGKILVAGLCALLTVILLVLVLHADVAPIGPEGTQIGLSHLNQAVHTWTGVRMTWYQITELLGAAAIALAGVFALVGLVQLIRRRSLRQVDGEILALGALFVVVICLYVFFEIVAVNYRPVVMPGDAHPEASFPSSHTMLACTVFGAAMMLVRKYVPYKDLRKILQWLGVVLICITVVGRLLSGVHWFTDILGGVLISAALLALFSAALDRIRAEAVRD